MFVGNATKAESISMKHVEYIRMKLALKLQYLNSIWVLILEQFEKIILKIHK